MEKVKRKILELRNEGAMTTDRAYRLGFDCGMNGSNLTNCDYRIFSTPENTREWERGQQNKVFFIAGMKRMREMMRDKLQGNQQSQAASKTEEIKYFTHTNSDTAPHHCIYCGRDWDIVSDGKINCRPISLIFPRW